MRLTNKTKHLISVAFVLIVLLLGYHSMVARFDKLAFIIWEIFFLASILKERFRRSLFLLSGLFISCATIIYVVKAYGPGVQYYIDDFSKWSYYSFGAAILLLLYDFTLEKYFVDKNKGKK